MGGDQETCSWITVLGEQKEHQEKQISKETDWLLLVEHLLCAELSLGSGDMVMNTKDVFAFMEQTLW